MALVLAAELFPVAAVKSANSQELNGTSWRVAPAAFPETFATAKPATVSNRFFPPTSKL